MATRIYPSGEQMYAFRDGLWWDVRVRKVPLDPGDLWDVWLERRVCKLTKSDCMGAYGGLVFAMSKRAMTREQTAELLRSRRKTQKLHRQRRSRTRVKCHAK